MLISQLKVSCSNFSPVCDYWTPQAASLQTSRIGAKIGAGFRNIGAEFEKYWQKSDSPGSSPGARQPWAHKHRTTKNATKTNRLKMVKKMTTSKTAMYNRHWKWPKNAFESGKIDSNEKWRRRKRQKKKTTSKALKEIMSKSKKTSTSNSTKKRWRRNRRKYDDVESDESRFFLIAFTVVFSSLPTSSFFVVFFVSFEIDVSFDAFDIVFSPLSTYFFSFVVSSSVSTCTKKRRRRKRRKKTTSKQRCHAMNYTYLFKCCVSGH